MPDVTGPRLETLALKGLRQIYFYISYFDHEIDFMFSYNNVEQMNLN